MALRRLLSQRMQGLNPLGALLAASGTTTSNAWGVAPATALPTSQAEAGCSGRGPVAAPSAWGSIAGYAIDASRRAHIPSRKPAVKKPSAHQWHYCDVNYDPMAPLPLNKVPPYAPAWAQKKEYNRIFWEQYPTKHNRA